MFVSMIFIRALFFCLVPFTKLDEGFTELPTDRGVLDQLPERVVSFRSSKIFSLDLEHNSVST